MTDVTDYPDEADQEPSPQLDDGPETPVQIGEIHNVIDEMMVAVQEAKALPLSGAVRVEREEFLAMLEQLKAILPELDILYATRVQKERFSDPADYEKVKDAYLIDRAFLRGAKPDLKVMHPLPRITEISTDVDDTPHALYFRQMKHGIYVRMALIALVLGAL